MKVALVQMNSSRHKADNCSRALRFVEEAAAKQAKFVLLPENCLFRGVGYQAADFQEIAETIPGPSSRLFMDCARRHKIYILLGSLYEKSRRHPKPYSTSVLIGPKGQILAMYRKRNLFFAQLKTGTIREGDVCTPGNQYQLARVGDFLVGMSMCFDVRFATMFTYYAKKGANLLVVPAAFVATTGRVHWTTLLRARAIETLSYVLAPNQVGKNEYGVRCWGHSMVISPWGDVLVEASGSREEIIYTCLNFKELNKVRAMFPTIANQY